MVSRLTLWRIKRSISRFQSRSLKLAHQFDMREDLCRGLRRIIRDISNGDDSQRAILESIATHFLSYLTDLQGALEKADSSSQLSSLENQLGELHSMLQQLLGDIHDLDLEHAKTVINGIEAFMSKVASSQQNIPRAHRRSSFSRGIISISTLAALSSGCSIEPIANEFGFTTRDDTTMISLNGKRFAMRKTTLPSGYKVELTYGKRKMVAFFNSIDKITKAIVYWPGTNTPKITEEYQKNTKTKLCQITRKESFGLGSPLRTITIYLLSGFEGNRDGDLNHLSLGLPSPGKSEENRSLVFIAGSFNPRAIIDLATLRIGINNPSRYDRSDPLYGPPKEMMIKDGKIINPTSAPDFMRDLEFKADINLTLLKLKTLQR